MYLGFVISAAFGLLGATITNYFLRDELGAIRMLAAIGAGILAGAVVNMAVVIAVWAVIHYDWSVYGIIGTIGGPVFTALAAWRWRPKARAAGDLRS